jgi:hypothetical protein
MFSQRLGHLSLGCFGLSSFDARQQGTAEAQEGSRANCQKQ